MGVRIPPGLLPPGRCSGELSASSTRKLRRSSNGGLPGEKMERKWVHVLFAVAGIMLAWLLSKCGEWAWSYFGRPNGFYVGAGSALVAGVATYICWKNEQIFALANEVTTELSKVTWPT